MNLVLALTGALLLSLICEKAEAQVAREAFYSIPSETASAPDFLMGKKGAPVSLGGQLRLAKSDSPKQPLVILLHSASGPITDGAPYEEWPRVLNEVGMPPSQLTAMPVADSSTIRPIQAKSPF